MEGLFTRIILSPADYDRLMKLVTSADEPFPAGHYTGTDEHYEAIVAEKDGTKQIEIIMDRMTLTVLSVPQKYGLEITNTQNMETAVYQGYGQFMVTAAPFSSLMIPCDFVYASPQDEKTGYTTADDSRLSIAESPSEEAKTDPQQTESRSEKVKAKPKQAKDSWTESVSFKSVDPACIDAYKEIMASNEEQYEDSRYAFLYFNDDDIPDLLMNSDSVTTLYSYADGSVHILIEHEEAFLGDKGEFIRYLEKKGAVYDYSNSFAGYVQHFSILLLNDKYEFDVLYSTQEGADILEEYYSDYEDYYNQYKMVQNYLKEYGRTAYNGESITEEDAINILAEHSIDFEKEHWIGSNCKQIRLKYDGITFDEAWKILTAYEE